MTDLTSLIAQVEQCDRDAVSIPREIFDFLMGTAPLYGTWFDEMNAGLPGRFWWRALLMTADAPPSKPGTPNDL